MRLAHHLVGGEDHRAVHGVLELAHVARPVVAREQRHRVVGEPGHRLADLGAALLEEMVRERRDVFAPLAQRGHADREDIDAVEEVVAERAFGHHGAQVAVGGADKPDVGALRARVAHRLELALLDDAQQLRLDRERDVADLVEEYAATLRHFEQPALVRDRAREGAFHVAEELAFEQVLGERHAIDRHDRLVLAQAVVVDGAGDELLAGTALSR